MARHAFVALVLAVVAVVVAAPAAGSSDGVVHQPPVDAPVVDPFRPPATTWGPGNRGLTYDLESGTPVRATAAGQVVFAGAVAGTLHVTIRHADGVRTSYSFLHDVAVRRGQPVAAGAVVGTAGAGFHLGARVGDTYVDPAGLFGRMRVEVRLVPHTEPLPRTDEGLLRERIALREVVERRGLVGWLVDTAVDIGRKSFDGLLAGVHMYDQLAPRAFVTSVATTLWDRMWADCTPAGTAVRRSRGAGRIALRVGGLGSTGRRASIDDLDLDTLGYHRGDRLRFSYRGGRTPGGGALDPALAAIDANDYEPADTAGDLVAQGRALADLIVEVARARPGVPIDLYAHSQGGVVTRLALLELQDRGRGLDAVGQVVTIATPHRGADLATLAPVADIGDRATFDAAAELLDLGFDSSSPAIHQLGETSPVIRRMAAEGVPDGVALRTIGGRHDLVVTADKTTVDGHAFAIVDDLSLTTHADLPGSASTTREIELALAGRAPECEGLVDVLLDAGVPHGISFGTNGLAAGTVV